MSSGDWWFPSQRASNAEGIISWHHHEWSMVYVCHCHSCYWIHKQHTITLHGRWCMGCFYEFIICSIFYSCHCHACYNWWCFSNCIFILLTDCGLVIPVGIINPLLHYSRWWLVAWCTQSHYLKQYWHIICKSKITHPNHIAMNTERIFTFFINKDFMLTSS